METLYQFVLRLAFGLALAMACTSPRLVTSGYYRVHTYVLLGLNVLAALVARGLEQYGIVLPIIGAVLCYVTSIVWLNEKRRPGIVLLLAIALTALAATYGASSGSQQDTAATLLATLTPPSGGLVLGTTIAAMFLGHWYLNTPTMELAPLRRLLKLMTVALLLRTVVSGVGLALLMSAGPRLEGLDFWLLILRWFSGILLTLVLTWMTWKTLEVPNTQSATGILYVAVITTFTGELTAQLLSSRLAYPV